MHWTTKVSSFFLLHSPSYWSRLAFLPSSPSSSPLLLSPRPLPSLSSCSQLFGEHDADKDVSPQTEEEEGVLSPNPPHLLSPLLLPKQVCSSAGMGTGQRVSTRQWAENNGYNPVILFHKVRTLQWFMFGQCFYRSCS